MSRLLSTRARLIGTTMHLSMGLRRQDMLTKYNKVALVANLEGCYTERDPMDLPAPTFELSRFSADL